MKNQKYIIFNLDCWIYFSWIMEAFIKEYPYSWIFKWFIGVAIIILIILLLTKL